MSAVEPIAHDYFEYLKAKFTIDVSQIFEEKGFAVIDNFFSEFDAIKLHEELLMLGEEGLMRPNKTHFASTKVQGQYSLFEKPGIFEVDFHQPSLRDLAATMNSFFTFSADGFIESLQKNFPSYKLIRSDSARTLKAQWNKGGGACFPMHYDNPGPNSNRSLTCIMYFNKDWIPDHGGELTLYPFLSQRVVIPPLFNRLVV